MYPQPPTGGGWGVHARTVIDLPKVWASHHKLVIRIIQFVVNYSNLNSDKYSFHIISHSNNFCNKFKHWITNMNYESYWEQPKLVTISQEVLISILEENRGLKEKVNELENIIGNLSRKWQKERHKNKQLKTMLYNAGRLLREFVFIWR